MTLKLTEQQARWLWLRGQGLLPPFPVGTDAPVTVAHHVCGLQAQDIFAAALGVRCRSEGTTMDDVERARWATRRLLWTWAMRGTMHLFDTDDVDWLLPLVGSYFVAAAQRRRNELGLDDETYARGLAAVRARLAEQGPSTREELTTAFASVGITGGYSIERHLLYRAGLEGAVCFGPDRGAKPTYVILEDWLGHPLRPLPPDQALAQLAARYLAAFAPATPADLSAWSGMPVSTMRAGWDAIAGQLTEVEVAGRAMWLPTHRLAELDEPLPPQPYVRLLPAFDDYLLCHKDRNLIIDKTHAARVNGGGGMIKAVVLVNGYVRGTWLSNRKGRRVNVTVDPFEPFPPDVQAQVAAEIADIERFTVTSA
jgi:hypothetical protein